MSKYYYPDQANSAPAQSLAGVAGFVMLAVQEAVDAGVSEENVVRAARFAYRKAMATRHPKPKEQP